MKQIFAVLVLSISSLWGADAGVSYASGEDDLVEVCMGLITMNSVYAKHYEMSGYYTARYPSTPRISTCVSLFQGAFYPHELPDLIHSLEVYASTVRSFEVTMGDKIYNGSWGNTCWGVDKESESWVTLKEINRHICEEVVIHPVKPLQRTLKDIEEGRANLELIAKYGRDFEVPENYSPHIVVAHGVQDDEIAHRIKILPRNWFTARRIELIEIDKRGAYKRYLSSADFVT